MTERKPRRHEKLRLVNKEMDIVLDTVTLLNFENPTPSKKIIRSEADMLNTYKVFGKHITRERLIHAELISEYLDQNQRTDRQTDGSSSNATSLVPSASISAALSATAFADVGDPLLTPISAISKYASIMSHI